MKRNSRKSAQESANSAVNTFPITLAAEQGESYYMLTLRKFIAGGCARYALAYFLFALFSVDFFLLGVVPIAVVVTYRFRLFVRQLGHYNYSKFLFYSLLILWNIACQIGCIYLRGWILGAV